MAKHNETGIKGEQIAEKFLLNKGHRLLHRNWRTGKMEIDLITLLGDMLVFIEIKTRSGVFFGFPEEAVNAHKRQFMKTAAGLYLDDNPQYEQIRFDIVSIHVEGDGVKEIVHFEDAFF